MQKVKFIHILLNRRSFIAFLVSAPLTKALPWASIAKIFPAPIAAEITKSLDEIMAQRLNALRAELVANITANNALLKRLKK